MFEIKTREAQSPTSQVEITARNITADMLKSFKTEIDTATEAAVKSAVERGMAHANQLAIVLIDAVETKIKGIEIPTEKIMFVNVNDVERKLSKPASKILPQLLRNALLGIPTYIKGPAGSGKTTAAKQLAEALDASFYRQVLSQDMGLSMIWGRQVGERFVDAAVMQAVREAKANPNKTVVILIDEIDAGNDNVLLSLNAFFEKPGTAQVYNPITGETFILPKNLVVVVAGNTWGKGADHVYTGRSRLDGASLRRFGKIELDYCQSVERHIVESIFKSVGKTPDFALLEKIWKARASLKKMSCDEIISTGCIEMMHAKIVIAQTAEAEAMSELTVTWPNGVAAQVGLAV